ncbi:MAG: hypothetical protein AAB837_03025 [Patescibacteria group bacterium]
MLVCLLATLVLLLVVSPLAAQEDTYVVQKGDTLWVLEGEYNGNPTQWRRIVQLNPFLQEPGRIFQDQQGRTIALISPGQKLVGLQALGIIPTQVSTSQLQLPQPEAKVYHVPTTPAWVWWPLVLAVAILIVAWLIYRMLTRDPVNSRPAMVQGGVNTPEAATVGFQQMAARAAGLGQHSTDPTYYQRFTVLSQVAGRIWGVLNVRYADGREVPRRLSGDRAYQARVRFDNGREEDLYMLQGCGNDLRYGGISRYLPGPEFRFEADPVVATPAPTPVSQPEAESEPAPAAQTAPAPEPAPAPAPVAPAPAPAKDAPAANRSSLTFEMKRSTNGEPHLVRFDSDQVEEFFIGRDRRITIRYREVEEPTASK